MSDSATIRVDRATHEELRRLVERSQVAGELLFEVVEDLHGGPVGLLASLGPHDQLCFRCVWLEDREVHVVWKLNWTPVMEGLW